MSRMKKFFTLFLIFVLFPAIQTMAGGTYHLKVGDSQRVSFTPHDGILTHTIRWVSYSASIDVSEYIGTTATIKVLAPIDVSRVIVRCEYEYIRYIGNFPRYFSAVEDFTIYVDPSDPTDITLQSSLTLNVGDFATLTPTLYPSGAETQLSWSSSNSSVASVSASGKVFGGEAGSANITVRTSNGLSATCRVTVKNPVLSLRINPAAGLLEKGSSVTLTAGSNNADIYYTLDGSVPTRSSLVYSSPIPIDRNVTLKAIAYCDGYTQSSVVTADYTVTSLKTVGCYPENNTENINRNAIPSITFNSEISESDKWNDIKLKDGLTEISGKTIISGNTLYFVPNEPLEYNKSYTFTLPVDAVKTGLNEPNFSYLSVFTMIMDDVLSVSAGDCHTMAIKTDGNLWSCGDNSSGQLGDGTESDRYSFVKVMDDVLSVSAGRFHTVAIKADGSLWSWGRNSSGQLGDGTTTDRHSPIKVVEGTSPIQSIDFDKEKIELRIGSKSVLQTYLQPFNAEYENILWNSTNENVATVSPKGVITAVAPGTTTITATVETEKGADCSASCIVTVSDVSGINAVPYNPLSAWIDNGMLHIKGLKPGNIFSIYDVMGKPVYRGTAESTEINRPIEGKGIFIVKTENCAVKVININ